MSLSQGIFYNDPSNFVFDSDKIEIVGSKAQLKELLAGATFYADYDNDINGTFGGGNLTGTAHGGASILDNQLDLAHDDIRYVEYDAVGNADCVQEGCFRFQLTPNYNGFPVNNHAFFAVSKTGSIINLITLLHFSAGVLLLFAFNKFGGFITMSTFGDWSPVLGQQYNFELNFNFNNLGETRLFIGGVQKGATIIVMGERDSDIGSLKVGTSFDAGYNSNFKIDNFTVFDVPQHTADYTVLDPTPYAMKGVPIMVNSAIETDAIEELTDLVMNAGGNDNIRFAFDVDGVQRYYYFGDNNWVDSDGTYAQSNDYADFTHEILAELLNTASRVKLIAFLYSDDGKTTPDIESIIIYYDFGVVDTPTVNKCIVWGFIQQSDGVKKNLKVTAVLDSDRLYNNEVLITPEKKETYTNGEGCFEIELIENASMTADGYYYFCVDGKDYKKIVPNEVSKNFFELLDKE